ncbi:MAG: hypothetical protein IPK19_36330 [Chloroflexi bacterium]|nr:hypothetical protein [Chloroflexota bacterium]
MAALTTSAALAQEVTPEPVPQDCAECHLDILATWDDSAHAQAFFSEAFQAAWSPAMITGDCLTCHTTNYTPYNDQFTHSGVACAACHGETPVTHPPEPLAFTPDETICADCHITTFREWRASGHSANELACATCHDPHTQALTTGDATALCVSCHDTDEKPLAQSYAHVTHAETPCADCHWHQADPAPEHLRTGVLPATGHESQVTVRTCNDCHSLQERFILASTSETAPVVEQEPQSAELASVSDRMMGVLLGLGIGAVMAVLFFSRRRSSNP